MPNTQEQADRWRMRAEEIRRIAARMTRSSAKWALLDLADLWDGKAQSAEVEALGLDPSRVIREPGSRRRH